VQFSRTHWLSHQIPDSARGEPSSGKTALLNEAERPRHEQPFRLLQERFARGARARNLSANHSATRYLARSQQKRGRLPTPFTGNQTLFGVDSVPLTRNTALVAGMRVVRSQLEELYVRFSVIWVRSACFRHRAASMPVPRRLPSLPPTRIRPTAHIAERTQNYVSLQQ
jgi:hypothetical protein